MESALQDSHSAVTVMEHVWKTLKHEHPELKRVVYRQNNAGCYHCATIIIACKLHVHVHVLRERAKVDLCWIDFCDPQGDKGPCDRKAAQIKTHVKQYINQGHSVTTPADLKKAIQSDEGVAGVRFTVVPFPKTSVHTRSIKCSLSNFDIPTAGIRAFKAYYIVVGNFRSWTSFAGMHASSNQKLLKQNLLALK